MASMEIEESFSYAILAYSVPTYHRQDGCTFLRVDKLPVENLENGFSLFARLLET